MAEDPLKVKVYAFEQHVYRIDLLDCSNIIATVLYIPSVHIMLVSHYNDVRMLRNVQDVKEEMENWVQAQDA